VTIEIGNAASAMRCRGSREAGFGRGVAEVSMTVVDEKAVGLFPRDGFEIADAIVHMRVGGEDVLPAIVVDVCDDRAPARRLHGQPRQSRRLRGLDERAAPVVAKERERLTGERGEMD